jgi:hypothetical protein
LNLDADYDNDEEVSEWSNTIVEYWIYLNSSSNLTILIEFNMETYDEEKLSMIGNIHLNGTITNGWNKIEGIMTVDS